MKTQLLTIITSVLCVVVTHAQAQGTWTTYSNATTQYYGSSGGNTGIFQPVGAMVADKTNNLWVGSSAQNSAADRGISRFDGTNWKFFDFRIAFNDNKSPFKYYFIPSTAYCDRSGAVWFGMYVNFFGDSGGGAIKHEKNAQDEDVFTQYTTENTGNGLQPGLPSNNIVAIDQDAQGNLWFGAYKGGIAKYDGTAWTAYTSLSTNGELASDEVYDLAVDAQGNVWVATSDKGIFKFDVASDSWTPYNTANGVLSTDHITSIEADKAGGTIWAGSTDQGLLKFDGTNWINFNTDNSALPVNSILARSPKVDAQGNVWVGLGVDGKISGNGLWKYDGTGFAQVAGNGAPEETASVISIFMDAASGKKYFSTTSQIIYVLDEPVVAVTGVSLAKNTLSLSLGSSETLAATLAPANATDKRVKWNSSNEDVATVDASGKVTAVGAGIATITVTTNDGNKTATCTITVSSDINYSWLATVAIAVEGNAAKVVGPAEAVARFTKFYVNDAEVELTDGLADLSGLNGELNLKATTADGNEVIQLKIQK